MPESSCHIKNACFCMKNANYTKNRPNLGLFIYWIFYDYNPTEHLQVFIYCFSPIAPWGDMVPDLCSQRIVTDRTVPLVLRMAVFDYLWKLLNSDAFLLVGGICQLCFWLSSWISRLIGFKFFCIIFSDLLYRSFCWLSFPADKAYWPNSLVVIHSSCFYVVPCSPQFPPLLIHDRA